jgi:dipeptidase D
MLNLDAEEDTTVYIGCAGGCDSTLTWAFVAGPLPRGAEVCRVTVDGLCGGHSGSDIHKNRGNANKLLTRTLLDIPTDRVQLAEFAGGSKRNALAREAKATVAGPSGLVTALEGAAARVSARAGRESAEDQPAIRVEPLSAEDVAAVISAENTQCLLGALAALPHGVLGMHPEIVGLVETSNNVATVMTRLSERRDTLHVAVGSLSRSSADLQLDGVLRQIAAIGRLAGADVLTANRYPGWSPNVKSPVLATCRQVYEQLFGDAVVVTAIHAGLECGIIGDRVGGIDAVSFGPHMTGAHSPDERVYVASVQKIWKYLCAMLARLAEG